MNDLPLVSIGMPTWNRVSSISTAIDSLLAQTEPRFELIISDKESTDGTSEICAAYAKRDSRIRHLRRKDTEVVENFLLKQAVGKYFMAAHDDDVYDKDFIKELLDLLHQYPNAVLAMCRHDDISGDIVLESPVRRIDNEWSTIRSLCRYMKYDDYVCYFGLYVTSVLKQTGGLHVDSRPLFRNSDYLTVFKVLLHGPVVYTNKLLYHKYDSGAYVRRYEVLKDLDFSENTRRRIRRFAALPISFLYDYVFSLKFIFLSALLPTQKIALIGCACFWLIRKNFYFAWESLRGVFQIIYGIAARISRGTSRATPK